MEKYNLPQHQYKNILKKEIEILLIVVAFVITVVYATLGLQIPTNGHHSSRILGTNTSIPYTDPTNNLQANSTYPFH